MKKLILILSIGIFTSCSKDNSILRECEKNQVGYLQIINTTSQEFQYARGSGTIGGVGSVSFIKIKPYSDTTFTIPANQNYTYTMDFTTTLRVKPCDTSKNIIR